MYMSGAERQSMERRRAPSWPCEGWTDWGDASTDGMEGAKLAMRGMDGLGRCVDGWDGGRQVGHARYEGTQGTMGWRTFGGYLPRSRSNFLSALPTYGLWWLSPSFSLQPLERLRRTRRFGAKGLRFLFPWPLEVRFDSTRTTMFEETLPTYPSSDEHSRVCLLETCVTGFESRPDMISALQQLEARLRELKRGFIETTTYSVLFYNQSLVRHCAKCLWNGCNFTHPGSTCVMIPAPRAFNGNRARLCNLKLRSFGPSIDAFIDGPSPVYLSYPMVSDPVLDLNPLQRGFLCSQDSHSKTPNPTCLAQFWTDFLETALCYIVWILLNVPVSNPRCDSQNPADAPMQISQPKDSSLAARLPEVPSHNSISTTIPSNHTSMELGSCGVAVWGGSRDRRERNKPFWWSEGACLPCKSCLFAVGYYPTLSNVDYAALSTVDSFVGKAILDGSIRHTPLADRSGILVDQEKLDIQKDQPALMLTERRTGAVLRENVGKPQIRRWIRTGLGPRFLAAAHLHPGRSRKAEAAIRALAVIVTHRWEIVCCLSDQDVPMEELAHERICEGGPGNGQEKIGAIFGAK
ncbi:hypothetical protein C8R43DRAFT_958817 [Mycena crocata]|nr:hypothetical protein C8R43DRAFT_958817 [Mycena crocata]